ncbi:hypothetical protein E4U53_006083 [Claviceps sorghi]|nr:hypothetical protein E4U53_006083 [Claviceps sorghi]
MTDSNPAGLRTARLQNVFRDFLQGSITIKTEHDGKLFLEAVCSQKSPSVCVEKIIASPHGLESIQRGVRVNTSAQFISLHVIPFLNYISHSDVKSLCEGDFFERILSAILDPPTVWKAMLQIFRQAGFLNGQSDDAIFARVCLEVVISSRQDLAAASNDLFALWDQLGFMKHSCHAVREAGYLIQKIIHMKSSGCRDMAETNGPGGRHDNDFSDFRQTSVFPTSGEFASSQRSFHRTAETKPVCTLTTYNEDFRDMNEAGLFTRDWRIVGTEPPRSAGSESLEESPVPIEHFNMLFEENMEYGREDGLGCESNESAATVSRSMRRTIFLNPSVAVPVELMPVCKSSLGRYYEYFSRDVAVDKGDQLISSWA